MNIFEEIKNRLDIQEVYVFYTGNGINRNNKALCPFHRDTHPSLSFKDKIFKCFVCDKGGDVFKFMEYYLEIKGIEAARRLNDDFRLNIIQERKVYDRRKILLEKKRQAEINKKKELLRLEQLKNEQRLEEIYKLNKWISLLKKALDTEDEESYLWAEEELRTAELELGAICDEWEAENKEFIKSLHDVKSRLIEWTKNTEERFERKYNYKKNT